MMNVSNLPLKFRGNPARRHSLFNTFAAPRKAHWLRCAVLKCKHPHRSSVACWAQQSTEDQQRPGQDLTPQHVPAPVNENQTQRPVDWVATGKCFLFPAIAGLLFGFDIGASSGVVASITSPTLSGTDWGPSLTSIESGLLVGMSLFGALAASAGMLVMSDRIGRKTELMGAAACYGAGALLMGQAASLPALLAGRSLYGVGVGLAMHAAPAYISETSPAHVRGLLVSLKEVMIVCGILLGYLIAYQSSEDVGGWREMYDASLPLVVALAAGMAFLPETPRWLLLTGKGRDAAAQALIQAEGQSALQSPAYVEKQVALIEDSLSAQSVQPPGIISKQQAGTGGTDVTQTDSSGSKWLLFSNERYWKPLLIGCSLMLFQQITGQPSVLYRAANILQDAGFEPGKGAASVAVILGVFKVVMTMVAVAQVDKWGRRPLLLAGSSGMVAALFALGTAQSEWGQALLNSSTTALTGDMVATPASAWISAAALLMYVGCYQVSFGPISWLLVGELFPLKARGQAIAVASLVNFGGNFVVSAALPAIIDTYGASNTYMIFGAIGVAAVSCMAATVPETRGKSLEEIQQLWETSSTVPGSPTKTL